MTLPVTIPNTFANATASIPLANLDANFVTIYGAVNGIGNGAEALSNVTITGGTIENAAIGGSTAAAGSFTTLNTSGQVVFNDAGADVDFRVEGDTDANLLFVDASADKVGIGTNAPQYRLHVKAGSGLDYRNLAWFQGEGTNVAPQFERAVALGASNSGAHIDGWNGTSGSRGGSALLLQSDGGDVGIGTDTPAVELDVVGQVRASTGILFGSDTAAANALDDYEEGNWTPTYLAASGTITTNSNTSGKYTKVGRTVFVFGYVSYQSNSGASGAVTVGGLPFTAGSGYGQASNRSGGVFSIGNFGFLTNTPQFGTIFAGGTIITPLAPASGGSTSFTALQFSDLEQSINHSQFVFVGQYQVA